MRNNNNTIAQQQAPESSDMGGAYYTNEYGERVWIPHHRRRHHHHQYAPQRRPLFSIGQQQQAPIKQQQALNTRAPYGNNNAVKYQQQQLPQKQQQQQPQIDQGYYDDELSDEYSNSYDEEYDQQLDQNYGAAPVVEKPQQQQQGFQSQAITAQQTQHEIFANMSKEELKNPANVKFRNVTFEASRTIRPRQLINKVDNTLKNGGQVVFSLQNGHLEPVEASNKGDVYGVALNESRQDLVKRVTLSLTSNYNKKLLVSLPTIGAIGSELFRNAADHVNFTIPAGALNEKVPYVKVFEREVPNGVIAFTNFYNSPSHEAMESTIAHVKNRGFSYVPFKNGIIHYWNRDHMTDGLAFLEENLDPELNGDVKMLTSDVMKYLEIAKSAVSEKISLGNVTTDAKVVLSACEGTESKQYTLRANKEGQALTSQMKSFMGLADADHHLGKDASQTQKDRFMDSPFKFDLTITFDYIKLDGTPIELLSK